MSPFMTIPSPAATRLHCQVMMGSAVAPSALNAPNKHASKQID